MVTWMRLAHSSCTKPKMRVVTAALRQVEVEAKGLRDTAERRTMRSSSGT